MWGLRGERGGKFDLRAHRVHFGHVLLHFHGIIQAEGVVGRGGDGLRQRYDGALIGVVARVRERRRAAGGMAQITLERLEGRERVRDRAVGQHGDNSWR